MCNQEMVELILQTIWEQHITRVIVRTVLAIS